MNNHFFSYKISADGMTFKEQFKNYRTSLARSILKTRLRNRDFTIISNNCWGAEVYKDLELPYATPFVGLFLFAPCYLRLLNNLKAYLETVPNFTNTSRYKFANKQRKQGIWDQYPIGLLGEDIEVHFMHYSSVSEASEKWARRVSRINWDKKNIFLKFCDRGLCTEENMKEFDQLDFPNKVCFTAKKYSHFKSNVWVRECRDEPYVIDGGSLYKVCGKYFNVIDWLNGGSGHIKLTQKLLNQVIR